MKLEPKVLAVVPTRLSEKLRIVAEWLESEENDLIVSAGGDEGCLDVVADAFVSAADIIRTASEYVAKEEPAVELPSDGELDDIAAVAAAFDESEDEMLQKQAQVLDGVLAVLSAVNLSSDVYDEDARLEEIKAKYQ